MHITTNFYFEVLEIDFIFLCIFSFSFEARMVPSRIYPVIQFPASNAGTQELEL